VRIGVNALYLIPGQVGGTEIYLRHLLRALADIDRANEYVIFTNSETGSDISPDPRRFRVVESRLRARFRPGRILWEQVALPLLVARHRIDVVFNPGFTSPLLCPRPAVTVFHDLQHKRHPENFRWFDLPFWRFLLRGAAHRSRLLLAVSEKTRGDLLRLYNLPERKVRVAELGVDPFFFELGPRRAQEANGAAPYLFSVSTLHPHKNLDTLIEAFACFHRERPHFRLIITGLRGFAASRLESLRSRLALDQAVVFTGWVPRHELYDLYLKATAFLYPSRFEGFGLPVLEALAAGVPTACSSIEPLAGLAGAAVLPFHPGDVSAVYEAMVRITSDAPLRSRLAAAGPARARGFSWENTARRTLEALLAAADK